jgi:hypothetical protein
MFTEKQIKEKIIILLNLLVEVSNGNINYVSRNYIRDTVDISINSNYVSEKIYGLIDDFIYKELKIKFRYGLFQNYNYSHITSYFEKIYKNTKILTKEDMKALNSLYKFLQNLKNKK